MIESLAACDVSENHIENNNPGMTVDGINQLLLTSLEPCNQRSVTRRRSSGRSNWRLKSEYFIRRVYRPFLHVGVSRVITYLRH